MTFSLNDKHILVNYHYVENPNDKNSGTHPCSVEEFEKHIGFLSKHYKPASISGVFDEAQKNSSEKYYSITFDDGLKSQYKNAVPILEKYGAHGTFFPIGVTSEGKIPTTHKIHILLSFISSDEFIDFSNKFLKNQFSENSSKYFISKDRRISSDRRLYEDIPTANLKETFVSLPSNVLEELVNSYFETLNLDEKECCHNLFINEDEIKSLEARGFSIGNHTYHHHTVNTLSREALKKDIKKAQSYFVGIVSRPQVVFCYPHGVVIDEAVKIVRDFGFTNAVTVEMKGVTSGDDPFRIPRYDRVNIRDFLKINVTV